MNSEEWERVSDRLFGYEHCLQHPVVFWAAVATVAILFLSGVAIRLAHRAGYIQDDTYRELFLRWRSWLIIITLTMVPVLLGAAWTIAAIAMLSIACSYEYARSTKLLAEQMICGIAALGIMVVNFAAIDHDDRLFFAAGPLIVTLIAAAAILQDRPHDYLRRVALASFGFLIFGLSLGYISYLANVADLGNGTDYRPIVTMIILGVAMNDVFGYGVGKVIGGRKLFPNTCPRKTIAGSLGGIALASPVIILMAHCILRDTRADRWFVLIVLGVGISCLGQLGDLVIASIKRDVGIKDRSNHGTEQDGILDRLDSLILVPPAVFHLLCAYLGPLSMNEPARIITGG